MNHPQGPRTSGESKPESPALTLVHQISRYGLHHKKNEVSLRKQKRNQHEHHLQHYHTKPTHKI